MEEGGAEKKEKENQLKRTKSRELRGGIMYYSCHCIKRNGLQHDCRRTGCGGEPACLVLPDPLCAPSQLARARGLADSAPLAAHMNPQGGAGTSGSGAGGTSGAKRFIVCELKGVMPDVSVDKSGKCCKCPTSLAHPERNTKSDKTPIPAPGGLTCHCSKGLPASKPMPIMNDGCLKCPCALLAKPLPTGCSECPCATVLSSKPTTISNDGGSKCPCASALSNNPSNGMFIFDEKTIKNIINSSESKELVEKQGVTVGPGGRPRKAAKPIIKEPCTRPGCVHWQPPPPCVWDAPCKADCFETPAGIQPGRNPLTRGLGMIATTGGLNQGEAHRPRERMKLLTPECCTGCSASGSSAAGSHGGPSAALPVMVMKLC